MKHCPYCGSSLLQTEQDGDETCLLCTRTVSLVPVGLPHVTRSELAHRTTPRPAGRKQRYDQGGGVRGAW